MSKHTPGPWKIGKAFADVCPVFADYYPHGNICFASEANARLIAAAPELLEALKSLVASNIPGLMTDAECQSCHQYPHGELCTFEKSWNAADAAIAKAEGR